MSADHIQPTPNGGVLLVASRRRPGQANAQLWSRHGELLSHHDLGDDVRHVLIDESGDSWIGYSDEALGDDSGLCGLVRFDEGLRPQWSSPSDVRETAIYDCDSLNVTRQHAWTISFREHHLLHVTGTDVTDRGVYPLGWATAVLIDGDVGVAVGGKRSADYDLAVAFTFGGPDGVTEIGRGRVVMPDGLEVRHASWQCRADSAWLPQGQTVYSLALKDVLGAITKTGDDPWTA